ncbi:MAG TPA: hypothetical protein VFR17_09265 [Mycobacterium sp.]|nr:hypothetical protein [Mycobacterium sp.]
MGKTVDLGRLAELLPDYEFAYLVTVDDDHRAHTATVTPAYTAGMLDVGPVGRHRRANLTAHAGVTLVFPPRAVTDYSLIVDGDAELPADPADPVLVTPKHALLHRPVFAEGTAQATGNVHDCVEIIGSDNG